NLAVPHSPIPRLVIVIDEFASLARELPDFLPGLVNIAQRGRSLGLHLIMATQRPTGVVSPEIRANTNLRIALRVTDATESIDIIDVPDAVGLPKSAPGRALARLGSAWLVPFQTARTLGGVNHLAADGRGDQPIVRPVDLHDLAAPPPLAADQFAALAGGSDGLKQLVEAIKLAAQHLHLAPPRRAYLEPLPRQISLADLVQRFHPSSENPGSDVVCHPDETSSSDPPICFALEDLPLLQCQRAVSIDPATFGHMYIIGSARSGKTTALRTIALAAANVYSPAELHIYGLDCASGGLAVLAELPHCGAVVPRSAPDLVMRLLNKLLRQVSARQTYLATHGYSSLGEWRSHDRAAVANWPEIFLLLDAFDGFLAAFEEVAAAQAVDCLTKLLREGAATGVHVIASGDERLFSGRYFSLADTKLVLRLVDRDHFSQIGLRLRDLPEEIGDGRAFQSTGGAECQIALPCLGSSGQQTESIRRTAKDLAARYAALPHSAKPFTVANLPEGLARQQLVGRFTVGNQISDGWPIGLGGEEVELCQFDPSAGAGALLVAGPARSGKTNALLNLGLTALTKGWQVLVAANPAWSGAALFDHPDCYQLPLDQLSVSDWQAHTNSGPLLLLVDEVISPNTWACGSLIETALLTEPRRVVVALAGQTETLRMLARPSQSGLLTTVVRRAGQGLLFNPSDPGDGDLIGHGRFSISELQADWPLGRAFFHQHGKATVLIPTPLVSTADLLPIHPVSQQGVHQ
ncbi:MAG: hypothetical protein LBG70_01130, partial [Bifidobacteriaceae bacterium]|nr:hypothetical protein [Bifidobacteriaceae bacterium]